MAGRDQITILHLSDLQFGNNHRFEQTDISSLTGQTKMWGTRNSCYDTLLLRIATDLKDLLKKNKGLTPEMMILTGDLSEWGSGPNTATLPSLLKGLLRSSNCRGSESPLSRAITTLST